MAENQAKTHVDLDGLRAFADSLRSDTEQDLMPGVARADLEVQQGVRFAAAAPGGQMAASRDVFAAALERAEENVKRKVVAAQILTAAIETILANYKNFDELSAHQLAIVEKTLSDAAAQAEAASRPAPQSPGGFFE